MRKSPWEGWCCPLLLSSTAVVLLILVQDAKEWRRIQILVSSNFLSEIFIIVRIPDLATSTQLLCVCRPETDTASGW